jgi:hypothetical protein
VVSICTICCGVIKLCILKTHCVSVFVMIPTTDSSYFSTQHSRSGLSNRSTFRSLWGTNWIFICKVINFSVIMLVTGLWLRRPIFDSISVHMRFAVSKVALWQGFLRIIQFPPVSIIPSTPFTHFTSINGKVRSFIMIEGCWRRIHPKEWHYLLWY